MVRAALALPAVQASDFAQAHALYVGAVLAGSQSDHAEARQMLETCLAIAPRPRQAGGHRGDAVDAVDGPAEAAGDAAKARAVGEREALQIFRELGDRVGEAIGLLHLGEIGLDLGDDDEARGRLRAVPGASRAQSATARSKANASSCSARSI